jgi:diaminohydroxyphosphoribosylaminopyrimidine deaminase/5-amino-6-(5-phosphoribosylamino)uracil reductase
VDAILVGANTVRSDNPRLTVRGLPGSKQPWRIVVSRSGVLPKKAHLFTDRFANRTIVWKGRTLKTLFRKLGEKEITSVLIEGGGEILGRALDERLVDKVQLYIAPCLTGGPVIAFGGNGAGSTSDAGRLDGIMYQRIGEDVLVTGYLNYCGISLE